MMRLLLDTHTFLWWLSDDPQLGKKAKATIRDGRNQVYVSAVSTWEAAIKQALGKLHAPENLESIVEDERFIKLPISLHHGEIAGRLPAHHRDPFDRMLVAQAQAEGLTIVTADLRIPLYTVKTLPAGQ
ncbi:type II toxin-antitoxin system VapC family toxin [Thiovibrio sp. JS02]